jgi:hypothetical protein
MRSLTSESKAITHRQDIARSDKPPRRTEVTVAQQGRRKAMAKKPAARLRHRGGI